MTKDDLQNMISIEELQEVMKDVYEKTMDQELRPQDRVGVFKFGHALLNRILCEDVIHHGTIKVVISPHVCGLQLTLDATVELVKLLSSQHGEDLVLIVDDNMVEPDSSLGSWFIHKREYMTPEISKKLTPHETLDFVFVFDALKAFDDDEFLHFLYDDHVCCSGKDISMRDKEYVQIAEMLGEKFSKNGHKIVEIPDNVKWGISESDSGTEWIYEQHRVWY